VGRGGRHLHPARRRGIQRRFDPLPVDDAVADSYNLLAARVPGRQPRARTTDLLIAATAHAHSAAIYTRNAAGLGGIEDLVPVITL
jgi:predicted nucleic acid-binding protein